MSAASTSASPSIMALAVANSVWVRTLSALVASSMVLGIYIEVLTIWKSASLSTVEAAKARVAAVQEKAVAAAKTYEAAIGEQKAVNAKLKYDAEARLALYQAEVEQQKAINAAELKKAESDLAVANAKVMGATSEVEARLARAKTEYAEAKALRDQLEAELNADIMPP